MNDVRVDAQRAGAGCGDRAGRIRHGWNAHTTPNLKGEQKASRTPGGGRAPGRVVNRPKGLAGSNMRRIIRAFGYCKEESSCRGGPGPCTRCLTSIVRQAKPISGKTNGKPRDGRRLQLIHGGKVIAGKEWPMWQDRVDVFLW